MTMCDRNANTVSFGSYGQVLLRKYLFMLINLICIFLIHIEYLFNISPGNTSLYKVIQSNLGIKCGFHILFVYIMF